jgi:hypothetical protein
MPADKVAETASQLEHIDIVLREAGWHLHETAVAICS